MSSEEQSKDLRIDSLLRSAPPEHQLEAQLLIARVLNWNRAKVLAFGETVIDDASAVTLLAELKRLTAGEPFAYIVGSREFYGLEFKVSPDVLIPRPDTELLVELAIERCPRNARVVDLGTGSGAIAVSLKRARPDLRVTATDASTGALDIARHNAQRHECDIHFVQSDWFKTLSGCFEVVVSNPPYIRSNDPHLVSLSHEPATALVADDNGLADIFRIANGARDALTPNGQLLIEHGYDQEDAVAATFTRNGFANIKTHKDLGGRPRVTTGYHTSQQDQP